MGTGGPASYVSAYEAMKFANYLTTGSAISGAYPFNANGSDSAASLTHGKPPAGGTTTTVAT